MNRIRSFLFVPGDSERKMSKAMESGADALILDLEDAVAPDQKPTARALVRAFLDRPRSCQVWVRVNPLDSGLIDDDLASVMAGAPDGIMLPKCDGPLDIWTLSERLSQAEAQHGLSRETPILPVATETAIAPFRLGQYSEHDLPRLWGLTWGAEDLSTALGAATNKDANGELAFTYKMVRSLCLMGARAAGVEPVETLYTDFRDDAGLRETSAAARSEGFTARLAIHPAQVAGINQGFMPCAEEIAYAQKVVAAFAAQPDAGTVGLDGKMLDRPHLKQAQNVLAVAKSFGATE